MQQDQLPGKVVIALDFGVGRLLVLLPSYGLSKLFFGVEVPAKDSTYALGSAALDFDSEGEFHNGEKNVGFSDLPAPG